MLIARGARINATNLGDDTPLHLAAAHGHQSVVQMVTIFFKCIVECTSPFSNIPVKHLGIEDMGNTNAYLN